jgi:hypothetical protein
MAAMLLIRRAGAMSRSHEVQILFTRRKDASGGRCGTHEDRSRCTQVGGHPLCAAAFNREISVAVTPALPRLSWISSVRIEIAPRGLFVE